MERTIELIKKRNNGFKRLLQTHDLGKRFLKENWEEINTFLGDCHFLIQSFEQDQQEFATLSESIGEDDAIIQQLQNETEQLRQEIDRYKIQESLLLDRLKKMTLDYKEMKKNSRLIKFYDMAEENLRMAQEIKRLKNQLNCAGEFIIRKPEYMDLDD